MDWQEWFITILRGMGTGGYVNRGERKLPGTGLPATRKPTDDELLGEKGKQSPDEFKRKIRRQAEEVRKATAEGGTGNPLWGEIKRDIGTLWPWLVIGVMILMGLGGVLKEAPNVVVQLTKGKGK